jgi:hypothetical protein
MKTIKNKDAVKCYKVTDSEMKCQGYQFELGKVYSEPKVEACVSGFHACVKLNDCFSYYAFNPDNRVFECTVWGEVDDSKGDKIAAQHIQFQKELSWHEVLELVNTGKHNTGRGNTGDCNTGDCNTGNRNTGNRNTGHGNTGHGNTGNKNAGDWNAGDGNTGHGNTGDWNSANYSTGFFNSKEQRIYVFNKPLTISRDEFLKHRGVQVLRCTTLPLTKWVPLSDILEPTEEDKARDGRLVERSYKEAWVILWGNLSYSEKEAVKTIPNFDADVFEEITGIRVS